LHTRDDITKLSAIFDVGNCEFFGKLFSPVSSAGQLSRKWEGGAEGRGGWGVGGEGRIFL